jgi:hypothetical protein
VKIKKAQAFFNKFVFEEIGELAGSFKKHFKAHDEAVGQIQDDLTFQLKEMKDTVTWCYNTLNDYHMNLQIPEVVRKNDIALMFLKKRLQVAEAQIVSLQLKLDAMNLKVDYPVEKSNGGRPKKV